MKYTSCVKCPAGVKCEQVRVVDFFIDTPLRARFLDKLEMTIRVFLDTGLPRRFAPRNDGARAFHITPSMTKTPLLSS